MSQNQIPEKLALMLKEVNNNESFRKFMKKISEKMNFDKKNILNLTLQKVQTLFINLKNKLIHANFIDQATRNFETSVWLQNQLRIFIYVLCTYLFLNKLLIQELKSHDYSLLQQFFPNKKQEHLEYQVKLLLNKKNLKWTHEQSILFKQIMTQNSDSNRWNFIAKQLFIRSGKKFFKTPKQCRERWINHEDPTKLKGNWETSEDINLLTSISLFGKKWTLIAHKLNDTRTQNSVKNRYNSLIKVAKRQYGYDKSQQTLIEMILRKKNRQIQGLEEMDNRKRNQQSQSQKQKIDTSLQVDQEKKNEKNKESQFVVKMEAEPQIQVDKEAEVLLKAVTPIKQNIQSHDFNFIFNDSAELQNVEWNGEQSHQRFNQAFYFMDGNFCFDGTHHM